MSILALDLGTKTGWAMQAPHGIAHGWVNFENGRFEGGGMRYLRFARWLDSMHEAGPVTEVHFEEVRRHAGTTAAQVYGGFLAHLTAWCEHHAIPYQGHAVGTIKKNFCGSGNASKQAMVAEAKRRGHPVKRDDEADAIAILGLALTLSPSVGSPALPASAGSFFSEGAKP